MAVINTNLASLNSQRNLRSSEAALNTSIQRLSSGLRVNSAKDDAAGLAIATRLDAQSRGMSVGMRNANDAISMMQIGDGALSTATDQLLRMRDLASQAKNGTNTDEDRAKLQAEFAELNSELSEVLTGAKFNGANVLDGTTKTIQVGPASGDDRDIALTVDFTADIAAAITTDISSATNAATTLDDIDSALDLVNTGRAELGAHLNKFDSIVSNLSIKRENTDAAKSRIMDTDFAEETAKMTRNQILQQAGTAMLAQANQLPNSVMSLLR